MTPRKAVATRPSRQSLADSIYEILLSKLVEGEIQAGSAMNIDSLARDLDVSPTPIREALARLESTGLVVREALRGYRAAPLFSVEQLLLLMDARAVIEPPLAEMACRASDEAFVARLRENVESMKELSGRSDRRSYGLYRDRDEEFHDLLADLAGNPFLRRAYRSLEAHVQRFRLFGALGTSDLDDAVAEHSAIVDAFASADPELAHVAMARHIAHVRERAIRDRQHIGEE